MGRIWKVLKAVAKAVVWVIKFVAKAVAWAVAHPVIAIVAVVGLLYLASQLREGAGPVGAVAANLAAGLGYTLATAAFIGWVFTPVVGKAVGAFCGYTTLMEMALGAADPSVVLPFCETA